MSRNNTTRSAAQFGAIKQLIQLDDRTLNIMHQRISKFIVKRHYGNTNKYDARNKYNIIKFVYSNKEN